MAPIRIANPRAISLKILAMSALKLRFCRARARHKNPSRPRKYGKTTKKLQTSPTLGWAPKIRKNTKKMQKWPESNTMFIATPNDALELRVVFPQSPGSPRGGNPRKMGKKCKIPLPGPAPETGEKLPKNHKKCIFGVFL